MIFSLIFLLATLIVIFIYLRYKRETEKKISVYKDEIQRELESKENLEEKYKKKLEAFKSGEGVNLTADVAQTFASKINLLDSRIKFLEEEIKKSNQAFVTQLKFLEKLLAKSAKISVEDIQELHRQVEEEESKLDQTSETIKALNETIEEEEEEKKEQEREEEIEEEKKEEKEEEKEEVSLPKIETVEKSKPAQEMEEFLNAGEKTQQPKKAVIEEIKAEAPNLETGQEEKEKEYKTKEEEQKEEEEKSEEIKKIQEEEKEATVPEEKISKELEDLDQEATLEATKLEETEEPVKTKNEESTEEKPEINIEETEEPATEYDKEIKDMNLEDMDKIEETEEKKKEEKDEKDEDKDESDAGLNPHEGFSNEEEDDIAKALQELKDITKKNNLLGQKSETTESEEDRDTNTIKNPNHVMDETEKALFGGEDKTGAHKSAEETEGKEEDEEEEESQEESEEDNEENENIKASVEKLRSKLNLPKVEDEEE